jgi:hypothetical protein
LEAPISIFIITITIIHLILVPNLSVDLHMYLFDPSYSIYIIVMMLFGSMRGWFHFFLWRWRNPSTIMNWNKDDIVFICIIYVVVFFNDVV